MEHGNKPAAFFLLVPCMISTHCANVEVLEKRHWLFKVIHLEEILCYLAKYVPFRISPNWSTFTLVLQHSYRSGINKSPE